MAFAKHSKLAGALALSLGMTLGACASLPDNQSLYSTKQPVVERTNYTFDVQTGQGGLPISEQQRLENWFAAMDLGYGDRVTLEDPLMSEATRDAVAQIAGRYGVLIEDGAPVTSGFVQPGAARVVITRSSASVPGCPDWEDKSDINFANATHSNYGCAVNSNLAAMVANPEDLIEGQSGTGETVIMSSTKAIETYRSQTPTGAGGLAEVQSGGD